MNWWLAELMILAFVSAAFGGMLGWILRGAM
jgi:hypothetical protein